jgi:hypothetical protein
VKKTTNKRKAKEVRKNEMTEGEKKKEVKRPKTIDQKIGDKDAKKKNETGNEHSTAAVLCMSVLHDVRSFSTNIWHMDHQFF